MVASMNRASGRWRVVGRAVPALVMAALAAAFGLFVPHFLDQDEYSYFVTVRFYADHSAMPVLGDPGTSYEGQMGPGYYVPAAIVYRVFVTFDDGSPCTLSVRWGSCCWG